MVKKPAPTVYLEHQPRVEHVFGDIYEQVTVPDVSPSIHSMVLNGTVGSMTGNHRYSYPDLEDDDELAHDRPDYEKLDKVDLVEKEIFVDQWLEDPRNYEKKAENTGNEDPEQKAKLEQSES